MHLKYPLTIILLILTFPVAQAAVDFYIVSVEPLTLEPGEKTVMNITIKNFGSDYATHFKVVFDPDGKTPVKPTGAQKIFVSGKIDEGLPTVYFGSILQGKEVTLSVPVAVSEDASFGNYLIPLKLIYRDPNQKQIEEIVNFGVEISGRAEFYLGGINTTPPRVYQDEDFTLYLTIENSGTGKAKNVLLSLELPDGISGQRTYEIGTMDRDTKTVASFNLKSSKDISPGNHIVYAVLSYKEENSVERTVKLPFEVFISERGDIDLEIAGMDTSPKKLYPGESFTLSIQIQNVGKQDAKAVKVEIAPQNSINGEFTSYLGTLKQDDTSTAIFDLEVSSSFSGNKIKVPLKIVYKDETGKIGEVSKEVYLNISKRKESNYRLYILSGIILAILILFLWRRRRRVEEEI